MSNWRIQHTQIYYCKICTSNIKNNYYSHYSWKVIIAHEATNPHSTHTHSPTVAAPWDHHTRVVLLHQSPPFSISLHSSQAHYQPLLLLPLTEPLWRQDQHRETGPLYRARVITTGDTHRETVCYTRTPRHPPRRLLGDAADPPTVECPSTRCHGDVGARYMGVVYRRNVAEQT